LSLPASRWTAAPRLTRDPGVRWHCAHQDNPRSLCLLPLQQPGDRRFNVAIRAFELTLVDRQVLKPDFDQLLE
jgi:hypothetical protein